MLSCNGPALPSILISPPPLSFAVRENGITDAREKSLSSILTLSRIIGLAWPLVLAIVRRPFEIFTDLTERSRPEEPVDAFEACGLGVDLLPRVA